MVMILMECVKHAFHNQNATSASMFSLQQLSILDRGADHYILYDNIHLFTNNDISEIV